MRKNIVCTLSFLVISFATHIASASTYTLPSSKESLIGQVQYVSATNDSIVDVSEHYNIGYDQIRNANPAIDPTRRFAADETLKLPTAHILPPLPRQGIIVNLSEMRLYYFPKGSAIVKTYPVGIGKVGKTIPLTRTFVARKLLNPTWVPTKEIRQYNREQGIILPASIPPGPDNPLGPYAIYLGIPEYRIHSTIYPESIGQRASFGCIRLTEDDIKDFFGLVTAKTPVAIIDMPTKLGWEDNKLYLEAHPALEERPQGSSTYSGMISLIEKSTRHEPTLVNWELVNYLAKQHDGVPHEVGMRIK
jgi:L,D-transpeptidase ErfK/SrfK